jgi:SAM-dependent methyltransferase
LLELARARAAREGVTNIEFRHADATCTGLPSCGFDAVVCVFGVFFAPDMAEFTSEMWRLVRPGGTLAITTWGPGMFEPATSLFWDAVRQVEPSLYRAFNPWDEITTPDAVLDLFARAGVPAATAQSASGEHHLEHPDNFWDVVLGTGYRATTDALRPDQRTTLRDGLLRQLRSRSVTTLRTDVIFGTATKPNQAS